MEYALTAVGQNEIMHAAVYTDSLSDMEYFFALLPLDYLHHDDRINPRSIGANIRGLIEEFLRKRPQLHVALAWWAPDETGAGPVKVFDGQHKAAAQIMLGVRTLPVRVFLDPDKNVLLTANTNAGSKLRQVAFDVAVMRHLGSSLFMERVRQYQEMKGLAEQDYSFSE
ncbi:MAG: HNH endonuclease, partial [Planctomycetota bacterium]